ncbi:hypothetical protein [Sinorhizobium meliloti]|uniref:hypothetical protein n=1 Tax=Rhizobium meliloti TaxID=382 RepID=UPI001F3A37CB|nr:hypothetical protein [Sinorhizobium meliloti]
MTIFPRQAAPTDDYWLGSVCPWLYRILVAVTEGASSAQWHRFQALIVPYLLGGPEVLAAFTQKYVIFTVVSGPTSSYL